QDGGRPRPALGLEELLGARRPEDGAPALDDVRDAGARERLELAGEETRVAPADADHLEPPAERVAHRAADRGVHPGRVATAGEDPDPPHPSPRIADGTSGAIRGPARRLSSLDPRREAPWTAADRFLEEPEPARHALPKRCRSHGRALALREARRDARVRRAVLGPPRELDGGLHLRWKHRQARLDVANEPLDLGVLGQIPASLDERSEQTPLDAVHPLPPGLEPRLV